MKESKCKKCAGLTGNSRRDYCLKCSAERNKENTQKSYWRNIEKNRTEARKRWREKHRKGQKCSPKKRTVLLDGPTVLAPIQTQSLPVGGKFERAVNKILGG